MTDDEVFGLDDVLPTWTEEDEDDIPEDVDDPEPSAPPPLGPIV